MTKAVDIMERVNKFKWQWVGHVAKIIDSYYYIIYGHKSARMVPGRMYGDESCLKHTYEWNALKRPSSSSMANDDDLIIWEYKYVCIFDGILWNIFCGGIRIHTVL